MDSNEASLVKWIGCIKEPARGGDGDDRLNPPVILSVATLLDMGSV